MIDDWQTILDHEFAPFGNRIIHFVGDAGCYQLHADEAKQGDLFVTFRSQRSCWRIFNKSVCNGVFRLAGVTGGLDDPYGCDGGHWFELILSKPAVLRFWGDQVLLHEDHEAADDLR
jgi:hypothetical protein